jgi:membrane associated rhomboid family serine protease
MQQRNKAIDWFYEGGFPLTKAILATALFIFVLNSFVPAVIPLLAFIAPDSLRQPWTLITYPLLTTDPIGFLWYGLLMWWVASPIERSWGTRVYAIFFAAMAVLTALSLTAGAFILGTNVIVWNYLPLAALLVAWCTMNPEQDMCIWGILTVKLKWIAVAAVFVVFFTYVRQNPFLGLFAVVSCAASYFWVRNRGWRDSLNYAYRAPKPRTPKPKKGPRDDDFSLKDLNPMERMARAKRKKQFQRLFEDDDKK